VETVGGNISLVSVAVELSRGLGLRSRQVGEGLLAMHERSLAAAQGIHFQTRPGFVGHNYRTDAPERSRVRLNESAAHRCEHALGINRGEDFWAESQRVAARREASSARTVIAECGCGRGNEAGNGRVNRSQHSGKIGGALLSLSKGIATTEHVDPEAGDERLTWKHLGVRERHLARRLALS